MASLSKAAPLRVLRTDSQWLGSNSVKNAVGFDTTLFLRQRIYLLSPGCGNEFSLPAANITAAPGDCSRACEADPTELCGAAFRLSVYIDSTATDTGDDGTGTAGPTA